jgi:hypothetical protein
VSRRILKVNGTPPSLGKILMPSITGVGSGSLSGSVMQTLRGLSDFLHILPKWPLIPQLKQLLLAAGHACLSCILSPWAPQPWHRSTCNWLCLGPRSLPSFPTLTQQSACGSGRTTPNSCCIPQRIHSRIYPRLCVGCFMAPSLAIQTSISSSKVSTVCA